MPIDARIPLGVKSAPIKSPMTSLGEMMSMRRGMQQTEALDLENQARVRAASDDAAIREALAQGGDPDDAVRSLQEGGHGPAAMKLQSALFAQRKAKAQQAGLDLKNHDAALRLQTQFLSGVTDDATFQIAKGAIGKMFGPDAANELGDSFDQKRIDGLIARGTSMADQIRRKHYSVLETQRAMNEGLPGPDGKYSPKALDLWTSAIGRQLSEARNSDEWDQIKQGYKGYGAPADVLDRFGSFSKENVKQAGQLTMTPGQREGHGLRAKGLELGWARFNWYKEHPVGGRDDPNFGHDHAEYADYVRAWNRDQPTRTEIQNWSFTPASREPGATAPAYKAPLSFEEWRTQNKGRATVPTPAPAPGAKPSAAATPGAPAGPIRLQLPDGRTATFKDKATADAFMKESGHAPAKPVPPGGGGGGLPPEEEPDEDQPDETDQPDDLGDEGDDDEEPDDEEGAGQ